MLYLDASALVKRYVEEEGSPVLLEAMDRAASWSMCRIGYVETSRAVGLANGRSALGRLRQDWLCMDVVEVDSRLAEHAASLAISTELRSLDALHLAAALLLRSEDLTVATWDLRLHRAAVEHGLRTIPHQLS